MSVRYNSDFGATGNKSCIPDIASTDGSWLEPDRDDTLVSLFDLDNDGMLVYKFLVPFS